MVSYILYIPVPVCTGTVDNALKMDTVRIVRYRKFVFKKVVEFERFERDLNRFRRRCDTILFAGRHIFEVAERQRRRHLLKIIYIPGTWTSITMSMDMAAAAAAAASAGSDGDGDGAGGSQKAQQRLRIACLIPSATDICVALGLVMGDNADNDDDADDTAIIVGITHECKRDRAVVAASSCSSNSSSSRSSSRTVRILTADGVNAATSTQAEIHAAVQKQSDDVAAALEGAMFCSAIPSLYPILPHEFAAAKPNLVLTQDLCNVCAPSSESVKALLKNTAAEGNTSSSGDDGGSGVEILSLTPESLQDVIETFSLVANACGVPDKGRAMVQTFCANLDLLERAVMENTPSSAPSPAAAANSEARSAAGLPRMLLLEWLDPPFDAGHWMVDMMEHAHVTNAFSTLQRKSKQRTWDEVAASDPDCVLISCCGFDLERNHRDAVAAGEALRRAFPRAVAAHKVYACDGDTYFANPGPNLLLGTAIMALAAYEDCPAVTAAIRALSFVPRDFVAFQKVDLLGQQQQQQGIANAAALSATDGAKDEIGPDIEDFDAIHRAACDAGKMAYKDPATGYSVFTELAHKARQKCCGSGCRHCPYAHENVKDKTAKIQQPAFLYKATSDPDNLFDVSHGNIRVLFVSGGKDSFMAIRALVREATTTTSKFGLVLITTFDATSRVIAHQDILIDIVVQQATHLDISLVGVPMHRGSSEGYVERVQRGLEVIEKQAGCKVKALVFGDLHLEHIKSWRDDQLGPMGYDLLYPLFNVPFAKLEEDLEASHVPCQVTSSTVDSVKVGEVYDANFRRRLAEHAPGVDLFGENGEFHTEAQVWKVDRSVALGLL